MSGPEVVVVPDLPALADQAAHRMERVALDAPPGARASIALAGGSTPRAAYQQLAGRCPPWGRIDFFFGDERCVPPDDPASNYGMADEALLSRLPLRPDQVHRVRGELPPEEAARLAEEDLRASVPGRPWPVLDLVVLGMGADGHTASLFPGAPELDEMRRLMVPVHRPELPQPWRVSMTLPVLNAARAVLVLVGAPEKGPMVRRAIEGDPTLPAGRLRADAGRVTWLLTEETAAALDRAG
ncbi:6-phosphogluconolactonase [Miltoncostaea marina]|uniref:6-phosphogluconolactonase n=1 Tax=Miltoncostaea marina TaxID=2843215 RepID=UPI001C3D600D|nr:6-phosphogluconolactonase [Miltoncostaea marina]